MLCGSKTVRDDWVHRLAYMSGTFTQVLLKVFSAYCSLTSIHTIMNKFTNKTPHWSLQHTYRKLPSVPPYLNSAITVLSIRTHLHTAYNETSRVLCSASVLG